MFRGSHFQRRLFFIVMILFFNGVMAQNFMPMPIITDDPPNPNEPVLNLPSPPSRPGSRPGSQPGQVSPGAPNTPVRPVRPIMPSIGQGAFPNMTCPLTDNRPHKDLLQAVNNLAKVVVVTPECQNNSEMARIFQEAQRMQAASGVLTGLWNDPSKLAQGGQAVNQFQTSLNDMMSSMNLLFGTFQNNGFLNSQCGQNLMTTSGVISSVADIVSSFAPFAMVGAAMNPSLKVALPYILGITGVGSLTKIFKNMRDQRSFQMDRPEHRQAVLDNVCEFSKISRRVRFLQMAQSGQIDLITSELSQYQLQNQSMLRGEFGSDVFELKKMQDKYQQRFHILDRQFSDLQTQITDLSNEMKSGGNDFTCSFVKALVSQPEEQNFSLAILTPFKEALGMQQKVMVFQSALITTEVMTRQRLMSLPKQKSTECAEAAQTYVNTLDRMVKNGRQTLVSLNKSLLQQLNAHGAYRQFSQREESVMAEVRFLVKIRNLLEQLNLKNAVIDKVELEARVRDLRRGLFGDRQTGIEGGPSPASAWLNFVWDEHFLSHNQFRLEFDDLVRDVLAATQTGQLDFYQRDEKGQVKKDRWGQPIRRPSFELSKGAVSDTLAAEQLHLITPKVAAPGSPNQAILCRRLESIWISWSASMDQLSAAQFFCDFISPYFDSRTESSLKRRCEGHRDVTGRALVRSEIEDRLLKIKGTNSVKRAELVANKLEELQCPKPSISALKE